MHKRLYRQIQRQKVPVIFEAEFKRKRKITFEHYYRNRRCSCCFRFRFHCWRPRNGSCSRREKTNREIENNRSKRTI